MHPIRHFFPTRFTYDTQTSHVIELKKAWQYNTESTKHMQQILRIGQMVVLSNTEKNEERTRTHATELTRSQNHSPEKNSPISPALVCTKMVRLILLAAGGALAAVLLGEKDLVDVGEHTAGGDGNAAEQLVELLVVADGELKVPRDDALALVVTGGVSGELEDLGAQVLHNGSHVHGGTTPEAWGEAHVANVSANATDRELQAGAGRACGRLGSLGAGR